MLLMKNLKMRKEMKTMETPYKHVRFHEYCQTCVHKNVEETKEPCNECLTHTVNLYSHKPVNYEKKGGNDA